MIYYDLKQIAGLAPSLATQVAREIGRRIVSNSYAPGDLVEDEGALAERYQVSRSVIRDAVKILVGKGLLEVRRGIGTRVRSRSSWGLLDDDVLAWYQVSTAGRGHVAPADGHPTGLRAEGSPLGAERGSADAHQQIGAAVERMEAEKGSVEDFVVADAVFHRSILRATENEFLVALEGIIFSALLSSIRLTNVDPRSNEASLPFHRSVYEAIAARDGDRAEKVMEQLLGDTGRPIGRTHV